jgi:heterodisulfide reductase subunit C
MTAEQDQTIVESNKETMIEPDQDFSRSIIDAGAITLHNCIQCGTCTGSCPSGKHTAMRIRKLIRAAQLGIKNILDSDDLWLCTTCYTCYERCPNEVEAPQIVMVIRNMAVKSGFVAKTHKQAVKKFLDTGHLVPLTEDIATARETMGMSKVPNTIQAHEDVLKEFQTFLETLELSKLAAEMIE